MNLLRKIPDATGEGGKEKNHSTIIFPLGKVAIVFRLQLEPCNWIAAEQMVNWSINSLCAGMSHH